MLQTDRGSQDDQLEWLQKLRAREMDALVKENVNLRGELQRLRAQMPQIKILEEKVERHEGLEQQLQLRVEELQAQLDQCEKSQEQAQQQVQGLQEQLMSAKEKEVELEHARERARKAEEDRNALNLKILDLTGAKEEAKGQLIRSDKVCSELLEKIKERNAAVELMKLESKELQAAERSRIESHQQKVQELNAEITKLNMECQQLRQQEGESCKAKEVMEERLKGKDHQLQSQEVELQRGVRAVEDAKVEGERRWAKSQDEVASTKSLAPFQKVFLEAPEDLSAEDVQSMEESREAQEISVEMPEQVLDAFPPISSFEDLQGILPDYAYEGLNAMGIEVPMPIQAQAIPMALAGLDVVGIAKTGSGKTLAYVLPALAHLEAQAPKPKGQGTPLALVLAPTRELAVQIADMAKAVTQFSGSGSNHPGGLSSAVLYGGGQGSKAWQVADVRNAGHLVAATPGRLLDVMDSSEVTLERVTLLVLDEADRMLECGFEEQVGRIGKTVRSDRQTLFFSATWPTQVQHMAQLMCSSDLPPVRILAGQRTDGEGPTSREDILQEVVVFEQPTWEERDNAKQELLYAHLREVLSDESHKTLVFVSRKNLADTLANRLKSEGFRANVMHGGKSQDSRLNTLEGFRNGEIQLLVTTDVMGRGLDIPGISHVVIYDMGDIEDYVHRIGRTARGPYGQGHALTFYEYDKKWPKLPRKLLDVLEQSGQEVPPELVALAEGGGQDGPVGNIRKPQGWKSWM